MFEALEFIDKADDPVAPPEQRELGTFDDEQDAIRAARTARGIFDSPADYAWWVVRSQGATVSRWIADSRSAKEFTLDLTTGELVEI